LRAVEAKLGGRLLIRKEVVKIVEGLMKAYRIPRRYVSYKYY